MQIIKQKYHYSQENRLGGYFEDAEVKNCTYKAIRKSDDMEVQLVVYSSSKNGQIGSFWKKINKFMEYKHPNLTPILECIQDQQNHSLFIVLEWTKGYSLKEMIGDSAMDWRSAFMVIRDVLQGLSVLHKENLVYSFINLQNIEIFQGRARLSCRYLIFKTYYLSPELKQSHSKNIQSDIFSVGVCLYRLIFGVLPFKAKNNTDFVKKVKAGLSNKLKEQSVFPKATPVFVQQYINQLCHFTPSQRLKYSQFAKRIEENIENISYKHNRQLIQQALGEKYLLLSLSKSNQEQIKGTIIDITKKKGSEQKSVFSFDIIQHNLTELSTYVDDIILPFKKNANSLLANVIDFFVIQKNSLVIIYDYCNQESLRDYQQMNSITQIMEIQVLQLVKSVLSQWFGQYRFLSNEQILINNGKVVIKFPPFPTKQVKERIAKCKNGNSFIAPEVEAGIQSSSADSWSVGALQYWMKFNCLPQFDNQDNLIIKDKSKLTPNQIQELQSLLKKKHKDRKNIFPIQKKPANRKDSDDSLSSSESPKLIKKMRSHSYGNDKLRMTVIGQPVVEQQQDILEQFQLISPKFGAKSPQNFKNTSSHGEPSSPGKKQTITKKTKSKVGEDTRNTKSTEQQQINSSQLNLISSDQRVSKLRVRRFPTISGEQDKRMPRKRSSMQQSTDAEKTDRKRMTIDKRTQRSNLKNSPTAIVRNSQHGNKSKILQGIAKQSWKFSIVDRHWSKPLRVSIKCAIALIIYIFLFYYSFFITNGNLMKNRYDFSPSILYLRSDQFTTIQTINFTAVSTDPLTTYKLLNNQTFLQVRNNKKCLTNNYGPKLTVIQSISSASFGSYQAFGFIFALFNLLSVCLVLAKLDLPKALNLTSFDENMYAPIYNWILVNLAMSSLISCIYLIYGGLFSLQIDPCLESSTFPSLIHFLKGENSSFTIKYVWVYVGMIVAYILMVYLSLKPKVRLHKYLYVVLLLMYFLGVGVRAMGVFTSSLTSLFGVCGQLLVLFVGIPLVIIDLIVSCRLRKIGGNDRRTTVNIQTSQMQPSQANIQNQVDNN